MTKWQIFLHRTDWWGIFFCLLAWLFLWMAV